MRGRPLTCLLLIAALTAPAGCTRGEPVPNQVTVAPSGGTFRFTNVTVVVPPGAVDHTTTLRVGRPVAVPSAAAPLDAAGALRLDVSLGDGKTQPSKPLDLTWVLPAEARDGIHAGKIPMLYTDTGSSDGFGLVAADVDEGGTLRAHLTHLSPKWLTMLDPRNAVSRIAAALGAGPVLRDPPSPCPSELDLPGVGTVRLGGQGWSGDRLSPVHACLAVSGGRPSVRVVNNAFVNWPVRASAGVALRPEYSSLDEGSVAVIAGLLQNLPSGQVLLPRGAEATALIPVSALPATVALAPNPGPFLAEVIWFSLNFLLGIWTGVHADQVPKLADKVLHSLDGLHCVEQYVRGQAARISGDFAQSVALTTQSLGGLCGKTFAAVAVDEKITSGGLWDQIWNRMQAILTAIFDGAPLVLSGLEGGIRTAGGEIDITVAAAPQSRTGGSPNPAPPPVAAPPQQPAPAPPPAAASPPPPAEATPVVHYDCPNDNSNLGHYVPPGKYWQDSFTAQGSTITGGFVGIGANSDGGNHAARVGIYAGSGIGSPLATVVVNVSGYGGQPFSLTTPLHVTPGQQLYLSVVGIGDFTAYNNRSGCFIGHVDGYR